MRKPFIAGNWKMFKTVAEARDFAEEFKKIYVKNDVRVAICVPYTQIAAMADEHLLIEKSTEGGRTFTQVKPLKYEERVGEIARIMSGTQLTENLYKSAKELLDRSKTDDNL